MLEKGLAFPYLIWPNLSASKRDYNLRQLVPPKNDFEELILEDDRIKTVCKLTEKAQKQRREIFGTEDIFLSQNLSPLNQILMADQAEVH